MIKVAIVGAGRHMTSKLIPALIQLQNENKLIIKVLCRLNPTKGDCNLNVPVISSLDQLHEYDIDMIISSGSPTLHENVINYCILNGKKCFVEKPHLLKSNAVELNIKTSQFMIGYNFNFMYVLGDIDNITCIKCGTNGIYKDWGNIFNSAIENYMYAFHSVIVHEISIIVQKYGKPIDITIDKSYNDGNNIEITIGLHYDDKCRSIFYTSKSNDFYLDIETDDTLYHCKNYKNGTYYDMFDYYFTTLVNGDNHTINTFEVGKIVLDVISKCEEILLQK